MSDPDEIKIQLPLRWIDDGSALVVADQFILRRHDNQIQLVVGHVSAPLVIGTHEQQVEEINRMGSLSVHVRGRFLLDMPSISRLHAILGTAISEGKDSEVDDG